MNTKAYKCCNYTQNITNDDLFKFKNKQHKTCELCKVTYKREIQIELKNCFCNICNACQIENYSECVKCKKQFDDDLQAYLIGMKEDILDEIRLKKQRLIDCQICTEKRDLDDMRNLNCGHEFCVFCLKLFMEDAINSNRVKDATNCPMCGKEMYHMIVNSILSRELQDKLNYLIINQSYTMVDCPKCNAKFEALENRKVTCLMKNCAFTFCKHCREKYHDEGDCEFQYIQNSIKVLEDSGMGIVCQCPRCKIPYVKDDGCEHVTCQTNGCGVDFCFKCAAIRSPTMEHGNHYHRPECKFFAALPEEDKDRYKPEVCTECKRLGVLCKPPAQLATPRKFAKGED